MAVYRGSLPQDRFVSIANDWARDPRMKLSQRGLLVYIASHKSGYKLTVAQMVNECADGRDAVYSALKGLRELGYLRMVKHRGGKGRISEVDYELVDPAEEADSAPGVVGDATTSGNSGSGTTSGFSGSGQAGSGSSGSGESASKKNISSKKTNAQNTTPVPPSPGELALVGGTGSVADAPARRKKRTKIDPNFKPPVEAADKLAAELGVDRAVLGALLPEFVDYWLGEGATKADWVATWRSSMRKKQQLGVLRPSGVAGGRSAPTGLDILRAERERRAGAHIAPAAGQVVQGEVLL